MSTNKKYTKIFIGIAMIAILSFMWGCSDAVTPPIAVSDITVTGEGSSTTVINGATLQMSAAVLPADAADSSVVWTVVNGTGTATISESGLLSGTGVGTVTVTATSHDGSAIEGTLVVTVAAYDGTPSPLASYPAITLIQTGDVLNDNVQYADASSVIAVLPIQIAVTLVDSRVVNIPLTWADTDGYDSSSVGTYTFTSSWGAFGSTANNDNNLVAPTVELEVVEGVLLVTAITVSSDGDANEVILDETLQMSVEVLPLEASDPSVNWSVVNGTGAATISTAGLLSGSSAGTVTVIASSNDSSNVEDSMLITVNSRPFVPSVFPIDGEEGVAITTNIEASFNEIMDASTMVPLNVIVSTSGSEISGVVTYDALRKTVTFNPGADLLYDTLYTATIKQAVADASGLAMLEDEVWTFTTTTEVLAGIGPAPINLRTASNFAILAKSAITTTGNTLITGDIGVSPQSLVDMTGFSETLSLDGTSATSQYVTGKIYAADMQEPTPSKLTTAISDVEAAYVEAAGRVDVAIVSGTAGGIIGGQTFTPGIYKWETVVTMATDITLQGGVNDVWIFQIADNLTASSGAKVLLADGAQAKNIFWQVAGIATLGTGAHFEGILMSMTQIVLETGSSVHGKLLAQTQVTLDTATVTPL